MKPGLLICFILASATAIAGCRRVIVEPSNGSIVPTGVEPTLLLRYSQRSTVIFDDTSVQRDSILRATYCLTLSHFGEPGFEAFADSVDTEAVWFIWLRSFNNPIAVRMMRRGASYALTGIEMDGVPELRPGKLVFRDSTAIDVDTWRSLTAPLRRTQFWNTTALPMYGLDGATWTVAASSNGRVYVTKRWSPEANGDDALVRAFGLAILRAAKLDRGPIY